MAATRNADNVRVFGSLDDAVWIAPTGTILPDDLPASGDLPAPWVPLGWLGEDGISLALSVDIEKFKGHQGGSTIRTKVTSTEKSISFVALEDSPVTAKLFYDAADPVATASGAARINLPETVGTVAVSAVIYLKDKGATTVTKMLVIEKLEIGEREDVSHSNSELAGFGMSGEILGDSYIITDAAAFVEALPAPAA